MCMGAGYLYVVCDVGGLNCRGSVCCRLVGVNGV